MKKNTRVNVIAAVLFKVFVLIEIFFSNKLDKNIIRGCYPSPHFETILESNSSLPFLNSIGKLSNGVPLGAL